MIGDAVLYCALSLPKAKGEHFRTVRMLLHLSLLALGAAYMYAIPTEIPTSALVKETLALLSTHRTLLIGNEVIFFMVPTVFKVHR